jgi:hypothetical protein
MADYLRPLEIESASSHAKRLRRLPPGDAPSAQAMLQWGGSLEQARGHVGQVLIRSRAE